WRLTSSSSVSMDLSRNDVPQVLELGIPAKPEDALDDPSLLVEQHRIGQPPVVVDAFHVAPAHQNREWRAELGDELPHLGLTDVIGDRRDVEVFPVELAVQ